MNTLFSVVTVTISMCLMVFQAGSAFAEESSWFQVFPKQARSVAKLRSAKGRMRDARFFVEGPRIHFFWTETEDEDSDAYALWHGVTSCEAPIKGVSEAASCLVRSSRIDFHVAQNGERLGVAWNEGDYTVKAVTVCPEQTGPQLHRYPDSVRGLYPVLDPVAMTLLWTGSSHEEMEKSLNADAATTSSAPGQDLELQIHSRLHQGRTSLNMIRQGKGTVRNEAQVIMTGTDLPHWNGDYKAFFEQDGSISIFANASLGPEENQKVIQFRSEAVDPHVRRIAEWELTYYGSWHVFARGKSQYDIIVFDVLDNSADPVNQKSSIFWYDAKEPGARVCVWQPGSEDLEPVILRSGVFHQDSDEVQGLVVWTGCNLRKPFRSSMASKLSQGQWRTVPLEGMDCPMDILFVTESSGYLACLRERELSLVPFRLNW